MFFPNYSATFDFGELWFFHNTSKSKVAEYLRKNIGNQAKLIEMETQCFILG